MSAPALPIEIFADPVCPWCYVGWRALQAAKALRPEIEAPAIWRPFLLNPRMPKAGVDREGYYRAKFGADPARWAGARALLQEMAADLAAPLDLDAAKVMPNTIDAHRLILWAYGQNVGPAAVEALCRAFWVEGRDIGQPDVLAAVAEEAGLNGALVRELLAGDDDVDAVLGQHEAAARGGITGVPVMLYGRRIATQGAISPQEIARAMDVARAQTG